MKQVYLLISLFISTWSYAQVYSYIDFGSPSSEYVTPGNWNNITTSQSNQTGITASIIDEDGNGTGITLTVDDPFDNVNLNGTDNPGTFLPFTDSATTDSFFGETSPFNNNLQPTGGFVLEGLSQNSFYSFIIFASRIGDGNRETLYTINGSSTKSATLQVGNNTDRTANILNLQPDANGRITFRAKKGTNNDTPLGFYYLGAIQLIESSTPITNESQQVLDLTYPNGGNIMEAGKTVRLTWDSRAIENVAIEFSANNGTSWSNVATVDASQGFYDYQVPSRITSSALIRISGAGITKVSESPFSIIENDGLVYRIVVLGSSTAEGVGPELRSDGWVQSYEEYLEQIDTRYEVVNFGKGGYTTYDILPTGTTIPAGVERTVDPQRNVTRALSLNPGGIIINMPSNDAAYGYPADDQMDNYILISNLINEQNIPLWVTTPQPRSFTSGDKVDIQLEMLDRISDQYGTMTLDFWTGFGESDNNGILPAYDSGDGVHLNARGHRILLERVIDAEIGEGVEDFVLDVDDLSVNLQNSFKLYPNPVQSSCVIQLGSPITTEADWILYDVLGKQVSSGKMMLNSGKGRWFKGAVNPGIYVIKFVYEQKINTQRLIIQ